MKKYILLFILFMLFPTYSYAKETEITDNCSVRIDNTNIYRLTDGKFSTTIEGESEDTVNIKCESKIKYVYIYYQGSSSKGKIGDQKIGQNGYLHELIKLDEPSKEITIKYDGDYSLAEMCFFDDDVPSWVEDWQRLDKADMMLFSTHADDEQLFFAGLMPTYVNDGKKIQVIYFTNHYNNINRYHELLEGLWAVGIKYYPVMSTFPDAYSETLEAALKNLEKSGYTKDDAIRFEVEQIRKYKPEVVVGHDINGEYSHGQHILNTNVLIEAYKLASDETYKSNYDPWSISKLYLHLYDKNKITLDYDTPLKAFNNKTAYEVSKEGFSHHYSQKYTWFTEWLYGPDKNPYTKASQITKYSPMEFGLYYSSVGEDIKKNDMFENISVKKEDTPSKEVDKPATNHDKVIIKEDSADSISDKLKAHTGLIIFLLIDLIVIVGLIKRIK